MSPTLDPRLYVVRPGAAAEELRGEVDAAVYLKPELKQISEPCAPVHQVGRFDTEMITEALHGEQVHVYEEHEGWAWVQLLRDRYVGYMPSAALAPPQAVATHHVSVLRAFVFPVPDIKASPLSALSMGSTVESMGANGAFEAIRGGGFIHKMHLRRAGEFAPDWVGVAEQFVGAPYLWGGKQSTGLDCSGLIQVAAHAAGMEAPRDSDMLRHNFGKPLPEEPDRRGDVVFWKGHVGVLCDAETLLHANAHHMICVREPFVDARQRIAEAAGGILQCNRL